MIHLSIMNDNWDLSRDTSVFVCLCLCAFRGHAAFYLCMAAHTHTPQHSLERSVEPSALLRSVSVLEVTYKHALSRKVVFNELKKSESLSTL